LSLFFCSSQPGYTDHCRPAHLLRRRLWERNTPEMDAAMTIYLAARNERIGSKSKRKA
jgi:hypothetical protein